MIATNETNPEPQLQPKACPRCDYSLIGLPLIGKCPECGRPYDDLRIYLYGQGTGKLKGAWSTTLTPRQALRSGLYVCAMSAIFIWSDYPRPSFFALFYIPFFLLLPFGFRIWRSLNDQGSGVVQVRLESSGISQGVRGVGAIPYEAADEQKPIPWRRVGGIQLKPAEGHKVHIRLASSPRKYAEEYVNALVSCTPEELAELRRRIEKWCPGCGAQS